MRKRKYVSLQETDHQRVLLTGAGGDERSGENEQQQRLLLTAEEALARGGGASAASFPVPRCHNIVSTSQIMTSQTSINLQRLADLFPFTTYDRKRFAAITIRLANPYCTCLLFGSGKLVITGSTSFSACIVASHEITRILRKANPRDRFEVCSCQIQNLVAHVSLAPGTTIDLNRLYERFNEQSTYQRSIFPGLLLGICACASAREDNFFFWGGAARAGPAPPEVAHRAADLHLRPHRLHRGAIVRGHLLRLRRDLQHPSAVHPLSEQEQ